ncbi:MAG TPA: hypothetical protein VMW63_03775, partial [Methanoregulaceae archaeon]|nr:hypothetical protein [Methanoregulaceae archaeon]
MEILSKLELHKPLYNCGSGVYISQIFSGAKISITAQKANGPKKLLFQDSIDTPDGNAWIILSPPFEEGDSIRAIQELYGDTSPESDEAIVEKIPYNLKEMLNSPSLIPPIFTCSTIIPLDDIINTATVDIYINGNQRARLPMPGPSVNLLWTELHKGDKISAQQQLCGFQSPKSLEVEVIDYPGEKLPKPVIIPPIYDCSIAFMVNNLVTGAIVNVYCDGKFYKKARATGKSSIIEINRIKTGTKVTVDQRLCKKSSPKSKESIVEESTDLPPPEISEVHTDYIIVDGILSAEIRIKNIQTGNQIGSRTCAGRNTKVNIFPPLKEGEGVIATQFFYDCSKSSPESDKVTLKCPPPKFEPEKWNDGDKIQNCNNCYNYACDIRTDNFAQPGQGVTPPVIIGWLNNNCKNVSAAAIHDGLVKLNEKCPSCSHKVALAIWPPVDFHWYRQDS